MKERKKLLLTVRVTEEDVENLDGAATAAGLSRSDYLRTAPARDADHAATKRELEKLRKSVARALGKDGA